MTHQEHGSVAMGDTEAAEIIADWIGEGVEDLPDDTPVRIHIGVRSIVCDTLGVLRAAALSTRPAQEPVAYVSHGTLASLERQYGGLYQMKPPKWANEETTVPLYAAPQPAHGTSETERVTSDQPVLFGLEAQGHIPTVEAALSEGTDWQEIGRRIGWDGETARQYYERHLARAALATPTPKEESK